MNYDYNETPSRVKKNASLYKRIDADDLDTLEPSSNSKVLEKNTTNTIDVEKLKSMLDRQYREPVKKEKENTPVYLKKEVSLEETREYDLNDIISKEKEKQVVDYEKERVKDISDISILDELEINDKKKSIVSSEPKKLAELIDTINIKEQEGYEKLKETSDDMFSELKSNDEETKVVGAKEIEEMVSDKEEISKDSNETINEVTNENVTNDDEEADYEDDTVSLTTTQVFTKDDFEEFEDLKDATKPKFFVKFLIFLVIVIVICGTVFLLNRFLDLGLF